MRLLLRLATLCAFATAVPTTLYAQAAIAGTVRDPSGAVLPGVVVEAMSPALIEKVRTAVSDGTGQYRIADLRPGTYTLTFSLPGFTSLKRDGIELTGSFTATINAELRVGEIAETVTVTGESPIVDVQNAKHEMTLNSDVVKSIPTVRNYNALVVVVPGVTTNNNDVATGPLIVQFPIHGGRSNESRLTVDGLNVGNPPGGNQPPTYVADIGNSQEVTFTSAGGLGEVETAGLVMNVVPRTGGNSFEGSVYFSGTGKDLQSNNYTQELKDAGLLAPTPISKVYDLSAAFGGPIMRDRIWFFANARTQGSTRIIANLYYNQNAADPTKWTYLPDFAREVYSDRTWENISGRVTWQMTAKNKITGFWDEQVVCRECTGTSFTGGGGAGLTSPEAVGPNPTKPLRVQQVAWSSPLTNRLLLDAGFGTTYYGWGNFERPGNNTRDLIRVVEQCAGGCPANGNLPGLVYRSQDWNENYTGAYPWRASVSYVPGAHSLKVGYQGTYFVDDRSSFTNDQNLWYRVNNGVPNQLTEVVPFTTYARAAITAFYVQEQWTLNRLTLQGALRYDHASGWFPDQQVGPTRFMPVPIVLPETKGVDSYNDITPRMGVAFDVFGNGRTAMKMNLGKYLEGASTGNPLAFYNTNPTLRLPNTAPLFGPLGVQRTWADANGNFQPDCDLSSPLTQDLRMAGGDFCGTISNLQFGQNVYTNSFDPDLLSGWGVRSSDWTFGVSIQQQVLPRASVEVAYTRRWFSGFTVNDNLAVQNSDYTSYSITAPFDPRLPSGGGYTVSGLYDVNPALFGQINTLTTLAGKYGRQYQYFNGLDVTFSLRTTGGLTFQGGSSTGQNVADACEIRANLSELSGGIGAGLTGSNVSPTSPYCHVAYGVLTQVRGLAAYVVPKLDLQVSGVFQSKPGPLLLANYAVPAAVVAQSLGRPPAGNVPNVTVNLIEPGTQYGNRVNQIDIRVAKILSFGSRRATIGVDVYNLLNAGTVLTYNNTFVPSGTWLQPTTIMTPRLLRISGEFRF